MRKQILFFLILGAVIPAWSQVSFFADIDGPTAGTASPGKGTMVGTLSSDLKNLTYQITFNRLQGTFSGAHFHSALSGGIVFDLGTPTNGTFAGTWSNIPDSLLSNLFAGRIYVNIHSSTAPGGEIRGDVNAHQLLFQIKLDGTQAGTASTGKGTGYLKFHESNNGRPKTDSLEFRVTVAGMNGTYSNAHFHSLPGGSVVFGTPFTDSTVSGVWVAVDSIYRLLVNKKLYHNVHSSFAPAGEIRGLVTPVGEAPFIAAIDGGQAGTASAARGTIWAVMSMSDLTLRYQVTYARLEGTYSGSHFHTNVGGGIVHPATIVGNTLSGEWSGLSDTNLVDLFRERLYFNIHSSTAPGGEIRGNLTTWDGVMTAKIDGAQAGTASTATGTAWAYFNADTLRYYMTIAGLNGTYSASHFHYLPTTGILQSITFVDSTASGAWGIPDSMVYQLVKGNVYINVHSSIAAGGEIRGALRLGSGVVTGVEQISSDIPSSFMLEQNYPNPFNPATTITFSVTQRGRVLLRVYNLLGQRVATLLDEVRDVGTHRVRFDAGALPTGVYFYKLETDRGSGETKKMVLIK